MSNTKFLIKLPHDNDIEKMVLSSMLNFSDSLDVCCGTVKEDYFYSTKHRDVFKAIKKCYDDNNAVDIAGLLRYLPENDAEIISYIAELMENIGSIGIDKHIKRLAEISDFRKMIILCSRIQVACNDKNANYDKIFSTAHQRILEITSDTLSDGFYSFKNSLPETFSNLEERIKRGGGLCGYSTSMVSVDKKIGGIVPGNFIVIAGRPGTGKTSFSSRLALNLGKQNVSVLIVELEMSVDELMQKSLSMESNVNGEGIRNGSITQSEISKLADAAGKLNDLPIWIYKSGKLNINQLRSKVLIAKKKVNTQVLVLDYIQLMDGTNNKQNKNIEVSEISRGLKMIGGETNIAVIGLSQLNRGIETRTNKTPMLSDLRDSGAIEQDADIVMFLHHENDDDDLNILDTDLIIAKNRFGETGRIRMEFKKDTTDFFEKIHQNMEVCYG